MAYNPFSLDGKTYLITGAASGIGRDTSIVLSKLGAQLVLVDINAEGIEITAKECPNKVEILPYDLSNISSIKNEIIQISTSFGKLNGLVHIAGKPYISPLKTVSEQKCDEIYKINTYAAIELSKLLLNKSIYIGDSGSIVFISSVYGLVGSSANVCYAMSKSALHGITRSLSIELASKGIRVNCVAPGFVKTNMLDGASTMFNSEYFDTINKLHPLGLGNPEDVAYSIAYLLSDAARWVTGIILSVDGGFTAQ
jgi:NAD(P)-dependent dehydrogenase (short-subunit alcohol dehydrogenase family)